MFQKMLFSPNERMDRAKFALDKWCIVKKEVSVQKAKPLLFSCLKAPNFIIQILQPRRAYESSRC